nr:MAG TPA: IBV 3A protein [Caudoviricetes sp.]
MYDIIVISCFKECRPLCRSFFSPRNVKRFYMKY